MGPCARASEDSACHGRLAIAFAIPFAAPLLGIGGNNPWVKPQENQSLDALPEPLRNNPIAVALRQIKLGEFGLEDLTDDDFPSYSTGFRQGLNDAFEPITDTTAFQTF